MNEVKIYYRPLKRYLYDFFVLGISIRSIKDNISYIISQANQYGPGLYQRIKITFNNANIFLQIITVNYE